MIVPLIARILQLLFAAVVLGLAVSLIHTHGPGSSPSIIDYAAFCGGFSIIVAIIGVVAIFFDFLQGVIMLVLDGLTCLFLLAGGIAYAVKTGVGNCGNIDYYAYHDVFWPSDDKDYGTDDPKTYAQDVADDISHRCRMVQADTAFIWFLFGLFLLTSVLVFFQRGHRSRSIV